MYKNHIADLNANGFSILKYLYTPSEVNTIKNYLNHYETFDKKNKDVFAIRQFLKTLPELKSSLFNENLKLLLSTHFTTPYYLCKAIYFNKPAHSNWFVSYHQDLSISVQEKVDVKNYSKWTNKKGQWGVIPPIEILENILTLRIHLDDTTEKNGALRVIPQSHNKGIIRPDTLNYEQTPEVLCEINAGGAMLMRPLTLHASNKTINYTQRRVIHLEFSSLNLHHPLEWLEKENVL